MPMTQWRFCHKCAALFFDGNPEKGRCSAGGGHEAQGVEFKLSRDIPETAQAQAGWRFCMKCEAMFFDGFDANGVCGSGGEHAGSPKFNFVLPHDVEEHFPNSQSHWRFCQQCFVMFFDGFPTKGTCPQGGGHHAIGFVFVLPTTMVRID